MSLLIALPQELVSPILSYWLTAMNVMDLDSAFCNRALREEFQKVVYISATPLQSPMKDIRYKCSCERMNTWMIKKGVPILGLFATAVLLLLDQPSREALFMMHGHQLEWIDFTRSGPHRMTYDYCRPTALTVAAYCPNLTCLKSEGQLAEDCLLAIIQCCPLLEELVVGGYSECTVRFVSALCTHCKELAHVTLLNQDLKEELLIALMRSKPGLKTFSTIPRRASENFWRELALNCSGLTNLSPDCIVLNLSLLFFVLERCTMLTSIDLINCHLRESVDSLTSVVASPSVRSLHVSTITTTGQELDALLRACPRLTRLCITARGTLPGFASVPIGTYCPLVETISISDVGKVGDEMLVDIGAHCSRLRSLSIPNCRFESGAGLTRVAQGCPLLEDIALYDSKGITNEAMFALAKYAGSLENLYLSDCDKFTDHGVAAVMAGCPNLCQIDVRRCRTVSKKMRANAYAFHNPLDG